MHRPQPDEHGAATLLRALGAEVTLSDLEYHATRAGFETDLARRRRSKHLAFSYGDVFERRAQTIEELVALMRA